MNDSRIKIHYSSDSWVIKDKKRASELHIDMVEGLNNATYLTIDTAFIPDGYSPDGYLDYLIEEKIISLKEDEG